MGAKNDLKMQILHKRHCRCRGVRINTAFTQTPTSFQSLVSLIHPSIHVDLLQQQTRKGFPVPKQHSPVTAVPDPKVFPGLKGPSPHSRSNMGLFPSCTSPRHPDQQPEPAQVAPTIPRYSDSDPQLGA